MADKLHMKTLLILLMTIYSVNALSEESCAHDDSNFRCVKYIKNYDGDTITFDVPNTHPLLGKHINVRVSGVDTPEVRTKNSCEKEKAKNAKRLVANLLKGAKRIDLLNIQRGKYFRVVADVMIDGKSLSHYLIKNGLGYHYGGATKKKVNWCKSYRKLAAENSDL